MSALLHRAAYAEIRTAMRADRLATWEASGTRRSRAREAWVARWHDYNRPGPGTIYPDDDDDLPIARGFWASGQTSAGRRL